MWLNDGIVGLHLYSVHHRMHGLAAVERVTPATAGLARRCVDSALPIRGALLLSTCNRVELLLDVAGSEAGAVELAALNEFVEAQLTVHERSQAPTCERDFSEQAACERDFSEQAACEQAACERAPVNARAYHLVEAVDHIFEVAAGLDSMVVGEREISGQLRRALTVAGSEGTASALIHRVVQAALGTSRKVAHLTGLASAGRSVVSVGLDVVGKELPDLRHCQVLLIGTGSYAGATVAALHERGCMNVSVYSSSGRAEYFARGHDLTAVPADGLIEALSRADLVVSCRGIGSPVLRADDVAAALTRRARGSAPGAHTRALTVLDLALVRDVEHAVRDLPGVRLYDLEAVRRAVPDVGVDQVARAMDLVRQGTAELARDLDQRRLDPAIIAVRTLVSDAVDEEIARLPAGDSFTRSEVVMALRRLAARMAHIPTARAHAAAGAGRAEEYVDALHQVLGIRTELGERPLQPVLDGSGRCPFTGLELGDLGEEAS